jgi:multisubunit Na+/H+ antiporter MnhE subunit
MVMFFFLNWAISAIIWLLIAYLFNFSILGWIVGLIVSFIYKEFIVPLFIIKTGDKIFKE